jgi:CBS domain containing-hemolysin-like protein
MAQAIDDAGEARGVVALEDVLEEIVGEVRDESRAGAARR